MGTSTEQYSAMSAASPHVASTQSLATNHGEATVLRYQPMKLQVELTLLYILGKQSHALQSNSHGTGWQRRPFLIKGAHIITTTFYPQALALPPDVSDPTETCLGDHLMEESAIPGAYQSVCMTASERIIPFHNEDIVIEQGSSVGAGRTGVAVWNSCLLLTRVLELVQETLKDQTILELGCGTGLASIVCSKLNTRRVIATDGNPEVVKLVASNAKRNHAKVEVATLQWGLLNAMDFSEVADIVIGSDLTYNSGMWRALAETVYTVLKPGGTFLYLTLGHTGFNVKGELDGFLEIIQNEGLVLEAMKSKELEMLMLTQSIRSAQESAVLEGTGGIRVAVMAKLR
jgi:SAM-dependent methyltransferase